MPTTQTNMYAARIGAGIVSVLLLAAAVGITNDFFILDYAISILFFALAILLYLLNAKQPAIFCVLAGFIFTPYLSLHLPRQIWVILDLLATGGIVYAVYWATNAHKKGARFENYVTTLFPASEYVIQERTHDSSKRLNRTVESDFHPDFVFRSLKSGKVFAVECKFRSRWAQQVNAGEGIWWNLDQQLRYTEYQTKSGIPVYVALGIGGAPEKPKEVYFLELERLNYPFLFKSLVRSGKRADQLGE